MFKDTLDIATLDLGADLFINGGDGRDEVRFSGDVTLPGKDLTVKAETITVNAGVTLSTRTIAPTTTC